MAAAGPQGRQRRREPQQHSRARPDPLILDSVLEKKCRAQDQGDDADPVQKHKPEAGL